MKPTGVNPVWLKLSAASFGLPDARIVTVDHPLGGTDRATIERWADAAVDTVVALLTSG